MVMDTHHFKSENNNSTQLKISPTTSINSEHEFMHRLINEINQPLGVIANYIHGCIRRLQSGQQEINKLLDAMKQAAQQINRTSG